MEHLNHRKLRLIEFILKEEHVEAIEKMEEIAFQIAYDEDAKTKVIGFRPNGFAVIKQEFVESLIQNLRDIECGEYITMDELEQRSENW